MSMLVGKAGSDVRRVAGGGVGAAARRFARRLVPALVVPTLAIAAVAVGLASLPARAEQPVDLQLVLAVDVSMSMDAEEQRLQRQGYAEALTSAEVLDAIAKGATQAIAVAYVEWAGSSDQTLLIDWRKIDGPASARAFADELLGKPYRRVYRTSISGGLMFSLPLFDRSAFVGERRVIDVSGDGVNNQGILVTQARDAVVEQGITINGLPILINRSYSSFYDVPDLDLYYADCVIGGEGAFMVPIKTPEDFLPATRRKILMEVADLMPVAAPRFVPAVGSGSACDIGERIWRERSGGWAN
jgi:hypothetical protein